MNMLNSTDSAAMLSQHPGFGRVFKHAQLTVGLILPLESHPESPAPTMHEHGKMAQKADAQGFASLWLRDVPFYDPHYGDIAQVFDPIAYLGYLAAITTDISLGTTGLVLPLREPLMLSKQATSLDQLSGGRLVLGLSSGDRPAEYPLFGIDFDTRADRFREAFDMYRQLTEQTYPVFNSVRFGKSDGGFDLIPKPVTGRLPSIAVGQSQQSLQWIAENMDGLIRAAPDPYDIPDLAQRWDVMVKNVAGESAYKPLGLGCYMDLRDNPRAPLRRIGGGFSSGRNALIAFLSEAREAGVNHVALNPKVSRRPYSELMDELAEDVLPLFPSHS